MLISKSVRQYFTSCSLFLLLCSRSAMSGSRIHLISPSTVTFIDAKTSKLIDEKLINTPGFSIDQLMELAGFSVACAVHDFYSSIYDNNAANRQITIVSGPGNNGGDGLVAARHLKHFGYAPNLIYPKKSKGILFDNLLQQCKDLDIPVSQTIPVATLNEAAIVVDAVFGFSFQGPIRDPFIDIINSFSSINVPVFSVDIPSGWDVDYGDIYRTNFIPTALISLTLPKKSTKEYGGVHYIGGRFIPPFLQQELNLKLPAYGFGQNQIVKLISEQNLEKSVETCKSDADEIVAMYVTASTEEEAMTIGSSLVSKKLAACINIIPQIKSLYMWEGNLESSSEVLMMIKTRKELAPQVTSEVKIMHSYSVPESIVVDIKTEGSSNEYIEWVRTNTLSL